MEATIVELRYKMADVLKALERQEPVRITHRGRVKGVIHPAGPEEKKARKEHPFFGMYAGEKGSVESEMKKLRRGRYDDL